MKNENKNIKFEFDYGVRLDCQTDQSLVQRTSGLYDIARNKGEATP
jgi:hypothetical protein